MPKPTPILFTKQGYEELEKEHQNLLLKRPTYVSELAKAAEMGDRSENAAYKYAKQKLRQTDSRLRYLEKTLDRAKVVAATQHEYIEIGSSVVIHNGTKECTYRIVGGNESDPSKGLLSYQSPLGQALLRKRAGEKTSITTPVGTVTYKILKIS